MSIRLDERTWKELEDDLESVVVIPTGAIEQHGPHLPVGVDAMMADRVAHRAAELVDETTKVLVSPLIPYGFSVTHKDFCGTMSISADTYLRLVSDLGQHLADHGFRRLFFLNGHGGNADLLKLAARGLRDRDDGTMVAVASYWQVAAREIAEWRVSGPGGVCHAGEMETSLMLHLYPDLVRTDQISDHIPAWRSEYVLDDLLQGGRVFPGVRAMDASKSGVLGAPSVASAERGTELFERITSAVGAFLDDFATWRLEDLVDGR